MVGLPIDDSNHTSEEEVTTSVVSSSSVLLGTKTAEIELQRRVATLREELAAAEDSLEQFRNDKRKLPETERPPLRGNDERRQPPAPLVAPSKRGYLYRWVDRAIGWSGTKWALRFVTLENGKIAYYGTHADASPRYVLSLRGCAVRDEGHKANRRHPAFRRKANKPPPPLEEPGAYFFVFSVYLREQESPSHRDPTLEEETSADIVPLLRFSTNSLADQMLWIQLISETCAYCETDAYLAEIERQQEEQYTMAKAMPEAKVGTLAPLYFAPVRKKHPRQPSFTKPPNAKLFRTTSKNLDADKVGTRTTRGYPPSKPMHRLATPSYLSVEAGSQNYRGFLNLMVIILVVSNVRLILAAVERHGFVLWSMFAHLRDLPNISEHPWENFPVISGHLLLILFLCLAHGIEWLLSRQKLGEAFGMTLHYLNAHASLASALWIVWHYVDEPAIGATLLLQATITWMKIISYLHANEDYRLTARENNKDARNTDLTMVENLDPKDSDVVYPENVTLRNILYFWIAPTLIYQIAFPKYPRVRVWKVVGILGRMIPILALFGFLVTQIVSPTLANLVKDLEANNGVYTAGMFFDYWLKLAISNTYLWLLMFYFYFHLYLNLFAELTRWGDRYV